MISHSLRGHAHGRNGTPRDFSTLKGPDDVSNRLRTISDMSEITDSNDSDEESGTVNGKESSRAPDAATGMRQDGIVHGCVFCFRYLLWLVMFTRDKQTLVYFLILVHTYIQSAIKYTARDQVQNH